MTQRRVARNACDHLCRSECFSLLIAGTHMCLSSRLLLAGGGRQTDFLSGLHRWGTAWFQASRAAEATLGCCCGNAQVRGETVRYDP